MSLKSLKKRIINGEMTIGSCFTLGHSDIPEDARNAVTNLDDILMVEGVDGFIISPYDLSCSMGMAALNALDNSFEAITFFND